MFARTQRLLLRPGFPEDAPELARTIADARVVQNLVRVPLPYGIEHACAYLADAASSPLPQCLVFKRTDRAPILVGAVGLGEDEDLGVELGYWIARRHWNQGYATEGGRALLDMARALRLPVVHAGHFSDNPASARVLAKLGFEPTGTIAPRFSCGRGREVETVMHRIDIAEAHPATGARTA